MGGLIMKIDMSKRKIDLIAVIGGAAFIAAVVAVTVFNAPIAPIAPIAPESSVSVSDGAPVITDITENEAVLPIGTESAVPAAKGTPADVYQYDPELAQALEKMTGEWVDKAYYESDVIDRSVVFPFEFYADEFGAFLDFEGIDPVVVVLEQDGPVGAGSPDTWETYCALEVSALQGGIAHITYDTSNIRCYYGWFYGGYEPRFSKKAHWYVK
jgi:hypothetical protein